MLQQAWLGFFYSCCEIIKAKDSLGTILLVMNCKCVPFAATYFCFRLAVTANGFKAEDVNLNSLSAPTTVASDLFH